MSEKKKTKALTDAHKRMKPKTTNIKPFDTAPTSEAAGESLEKFINEYKRRQWFENPQSPRA